VEIGPADAAMLDQLLEISGHTEDLEHRDFVQQHLRVSNVSVAKAGTEPVGYVIADVSFFGRWFVHSLYVAATDRRRGVATRLLDSVSKSAQGIRVFTSTNLSNAPMHALLTKDHWSFAGVVGGLDEADPEVFYFKG